ncbi:MAG: helix-turn-helix transcriptional regulator, partial [Spirochaetaceae bacterium]|nr:helix-turn-helix transcriptional regulator [Spirochaetaceae bacterium]
YKTAVPNGIVMPFIELGKDMRTLTNTALKEGGRGIPKSWLENVSRKSSTYAKHQTRFIMEYKRANHTADGVVLSPREAEILTDLSRGLSRAEIAAGRKLSVNTVKKVIAHIYMKMSTKSLANLIRIAVEKKMI